MKMIKSIRSLLFLVLLIGFVFSVGLANITVFPLTLVVSTIAGDSGSGSFFVRNNGENPDEVTITLADWALDVNGNIQFLEAASTDRSLVPFVQFAPVSFQINPGEIQQVEFSYELPSDFLGDHWLLFLVDSSEITPIAETTGEVNTNVGVKVGFGVKVFQNDPSAQQDGRITGMRLVGKDPLSLVVRFANTGDAVLRDITGRVEIRDILGETVRTFEIERFTVLPGGVREVTVQQVEDDVKLPGGNYVALAIIDFGSEFLVAGELPFELD